MGKVSSRDGTAIAFDRTGDGPPVILVGGATQHRAIDASTERLAALLATRFTVFQYDRRGRGDSGDTAPYAVEREVEDLGALVAEAGGTAAVYGTSSGAALALEAARTLAITKLALYEPPFIVDDSRPPLRVDYVEGLTDLASSGRPGDAVEFFLTAAAQVPAEFVAHMRNEPLWPALEAVAHTLAYDGAIMEPYTAGRPLPAERWESVRAPTLVMDGGLSPAWARNAVQALVEVLPNARRHTLEGQTHAVEVEAVTPVLDAFFADWSTALPGTEVPLGAKA
jgi:pimeloyl-ACP methyl ester carboxylesterase